MGLPALGPRADELSIHASKARSGVPRVSVREGSWSYRADTQAVLFSPVDGM